MSYVKTSNRYAYPKPQDRVSSAELHTMIQTAAYFLAEKRGFNGDCSLHDWVEAEQMIHRIYGKGDSQEV